MSNDSSTRSICILGATGSIGAQSLEIISRNPDSFSARWITCNTRWEDLAVQTRRFQPWGVAIRNEQAYKAFKEAMSDYKGAVLCGEEGICEAAADSANDVVLSAMVGFSGVLPTLAAIRAGHVIGLANKESLVSAGLILMPAVKEYGATILAVDSEHSAIAQCLIGERRSDVRRVIITASGGPFRNHTASELKSVTPASALRHPNWDMGAKITIDSATLMNKGFEVIEAHWLFDLQASQIDVVVHPESVVHSMVEFIDGSVKAQMGLPSMLGPIQYALTYPVRHGLETKALDLASIGALTFEAPDEARFPCLCIAYDALSEGGSAGAVINAANEIAVASFLGGSISFTDIPNVIAKTLENMELITHPSMDDIVAIDAQARRIATSLISHD